jgi:hypothetical protein
MASTPFAVQRSQGQGALRSRAATRRMSSATSVVQRLFSLEHSGRTLDVSIHQHYGYRMHCEWTGALGTCTLERRFSSYETVLAFCTSIASSTLEGVCTCVTSRDKFFDGAPGDPGWVVDMLMLDKLVICYPNGWTGHGPQSGRTECGRKAGSGSLTKAVGCSQLNGCRSNCKKIISGKGFLDLFFLAIACTVLHEAMIHSMAGWLHRKPDAGSAFFACLH